MSSNHKYNVNQMLPRPASYCELLNRRRWSTKSGMIITCLDI